MTVRYADLVQGRGAAGVPEGGVLSVQGVAGGTAFAVTASGLYVPNSDAQTPAQLTGSPVAAALFGFNGVTGQFDRLRAGGNDADGVGVSAASRLLTLGYNYLLNGVAGTWTRAAGDAGIGIVRGRGHSAIGQVAGGANAAATVTLPAAGAGTFQYISHIRIVRVATAALAGTALLAITTTNIVGNPAWRVGNAMVAGGTQIDMDVEFATPLRAGAANTAVTIVLPAAGVAVSWDAVVTYYASPETR